VSDSQIKLIVESYLHMVAGSANVGVAYEKWYGEFLPENIFFKRLLRELAEQILKPLKMSRWGAGLRLLGMLLLQVRRAEPSEPGEASRATKDAKIGKCEDRRSEEQGQMRRCEEQAKMREANGRHFVLRSPIAPL